MRALLSVSDKTGIVDFAKGLKDLGIKILSTGGTLKTLKENNIKAKEVSEFTGFPEVFDGRVKTLNPMIHGGILFRRDYEQDKKTAKSLGIKPIDIVCVNLYPFKDTTRRTDDWDEIIENIDIGGPAMVRAAAKNHKDVIIITDVSDYTLVLEWLKKGEVPYEIKRALMIKAYEHTAAYDAFIANYMNVRFNQGLGRKQFIVGERVFTCRYGENPHQKGALYEIDKFFSRYFITLKGEASFNNMTDLNAAVKLATAFGERSSVSIIKHGNPCGFALKDTLLESYTQALKCDPVSAYGGVVAVNGIVDEALAQEINKTYIEVLIAGTVTPEALAVFENKKRMKIFHTGTTFLQHAFDSWDYKRVEGGFVFQESDHVMTDEVIDARIVTSIAPTASERTDLEIAWKVAALTKSNCVAYVKNGALLAIGMGMTSRVDAAKAAIRKAEEQGISLEGCVLASEAFFPFRDSIDAASEVGVKAIIQPGGSIRDEEVVSAANDHGMTMLFTGVRHFLH